MSEVKPYTSKELGRILTDKQSWKKAWKPVLIWVISFLIIFFGVLLILGIGYFFLLDALFLLVIGLLAYYPPSRRVFTLLPGVESRPSLFTKVPMTPARWFRVFIRIITIGVITYLGLKIILTSGFCGQNIWLC